MKKDKPNVSNVDDVAKAAMDQLLANRDDGAEFDYGVVDHYYVGLLASECCKRSLLVSFWYSRPDYTFNISIRAGDARKVYSFQDGKEVGEGCRKILLAIGYREPKVAKAK